MNKKPRKPGVLSSRVQTPEVLEGAGRKSLLEKSWKVIVSQLGAEALVVAGTPAFIEAIGIAVLTGEAVFAILTAAALLVRGSESKEMLRANKWGSCVTAAAAMVNIIILGVTERGDLAILWGTGMVGAFGVGTAFSVIRKQFKG